MLKKLLTITYLCFIIAAGSFAQAAKKTYVILGTAQGKGSISFAKALGSSVVTQYEAIGVVIAASSDPGFAARAAALHGVQAVVEDQEVQWVPAAENQKLAFAVDDAAVPLSTASAFPVANPEPFSALQWNLRQIHADQTADNGDRGNGVARARVAVLDTGIIASHVDIAANLNTALSTSFVPTEPSFVFPSNGAPSHATHVAGIIAAPINGVGTQGVAPEAEIVAVKVLSNSGAGTFSPLLAGIEYASGPLVHADIINMSLAGLFDHNNAGNGGLGQLIAAVNRAVNHAEAQGTLVISAAGNNGVDLNGRYFVVPANAGTGMAVSATGPIGYGVYGFTAEANFDRLATYSNYGQSVIDVAAPGGDAVYNPPEQICSMGPLTTNCFVFDLILSPAGKVGTSNLYYFQAGTSMATPHVSGLAALIVGKFGHMSPQVLKSLIKQSADDILKPGADAESGHGRINALRALQ